MSSHILLYMVILTCTQVAVNSRPSNESAVSEEPIRLIDENPTDTNKEQRSISYLMDNQNDPDNQATRDIVEKIKAINDSLKKPYRQQINHNQYAKEDYAVDNELLEKIKHLIATSKLNTKTKVKDLQLDVTEDIDDTREIYTRDLKFVPNSINPVPVPVMHIPYTINVPVFVMPVNNQVSQKYAPSDPSQTNMYQTRQSFLQGFPSLQNFQWPSPFASLFPIIVKDPLVGYFQGGGWNNFFEYGQQADVCNRRLKTEDGKKASENELLQNIVQQLQYSNRGYRENELESDRDSRALKRNIAPETVVSQPTENSDASKTIYYQRPSVTKKTTKRPLKSQTVPPTASNIITQEDGDLRMPFSDYTFFGNRKPTMPSPGFFINKLRVRKGGVAIAGPGGVATAGNGGTAIVGAGGLAYTKPGGLAVAGPHARVVALSPDSDFSSILSKLHKQNGTYVQSSQSIREGRLVATGPTIYYHPKEQT